MMATSEFRRNLKSAVRAAANSVLRLRQPTKTPLMVLGNGRSGTSWVGKTLGLADDVIYYREPCNPKTAGIEDDTVWSRYVPADSSDAFFESRIETAFRGLMANGSTWDMHRCRSRLQGRSRVIVKEVATFLSIEWLDRRWQPDVLMMLRHPCAGGLSVSKLGLAKLEVGRLQSMLDDERLVTDHLTPFVPHLKTAKTPLEVSAAIWAIKNYVAFKAAARQEVGRSSPTSKPVATPLVCFANCTRTLSWRSPLR